ncbi:MAG: MBL fold metallo-hydrolase [Deltaproteobacteria bacterium]|nr:MBL fold metallo-hydrolase [Deltaproteobacteria bacterium]
MQIHTVKTRLVNSYVIEDHGVLAVVDVAVGSSEEVAGYIDGVLQRDLSDVELVLCTHDDADHIGGIYKLAEACKASVAIPWASRHIVRKLSNDPIGIVVRPMTIVRELFKPRMWSMYASPSRNRRARRTPRLQLGRSSNRWARSREPDYYLKHHQVLPKFEGWSVIHTPGHSWDSCCYYHREGKVLLTGDAFLGSGSKGRLVLPAIKSNPWQFRTTFRHLSGLAIEHVYPGHGSSMHGNDLLAHWLESSEPQDHFH